MANWNGLVLTERGRTLQLKAEAGETLVLTKIKLGSGTLADGEALESLEDLKAAEQEIGISTKEVTDDGYCKLISVISNADLTQGYYLRELGVYADDPDDGEILYAVTTDDSPDYLPAAGGPVAVSQEFAIYVAVGSAADITVNINQENLATISDLTQMQEEMQRQIDAILEMLVSGTVYATLLDSDGDSLITADGAILVADWKLCGCAASAVASAVSAVTASGVTAGKGLSLSGSVLSVNVGTGLGIDSNNNICVDSATLSEAAGTAAEMTLEENLVDEDEAQQEIVKALAN